MELDHSSRGVIVTGSRPDPNHLFAGGMGLFRIEQAYLNKYICRFQQSAQNTRSLAWGPPGGGGGDVDPHVKLPAASFEI